MKHLFPLLKQLYFKAGNLEKKMPVGAKRRVEHARLTVGAADSRWQRPRASPVRRGPAATEFPGEAEPSGSGGTMNSQQLPK